MLQYEILLCVQDQDDPAVDVCKKLLGKYPNVDARLFIGETCLYHTVCSGFQSVCLLLTSHAGPRSLGGKKVGINPKINNLMPGYEGARYGLVWICDSGIRGQEALLNLFIDADT